MAPHASGTHAGHTPLAGGGALPGLGQLQRSDHAQTAESGLTALEARLSGHVSHTPPQTTQGAPQRPDLPQQVVVQIAAAAEKGGGGAQKSIDLQLNPEELGRVRLRLSPAEGGLTVTVVAERGETLDLLRRNIDMLAREFLEIGYEGASFDFTEGQPDQHDREDAPLTSSLAEAQGAAPESRAPAPEHLTLRDRLDIRL